MHPYPLRKKFHDYKESIENLSNRLPNLSVYKSNGLAHGYVKSICLSKTRYCFQLEHDWIFISENIQHSDLEIIAAMHAFDIHHLRFNKRANVAIQFDHSLEQETALEIPVCHTPACSNNPHFIDRDAYLKQYMHLINVGASGSSGIEEALHDMPRSYIYGGLGHPAAISHNDGRARLRRLRNLIGKDAVKLLIKFGLIAPALRFLGHSAKPARSSVKAV